MRIRSRLKGLAAGVLLAAVGTIGANSAAQAQQQQRPNIVVLWGDDIGVANVSAYSFGVMGYKTPNIDRVAHEGLMFTDYYAEQSCTAGRASFITGQAGLRTGLTKVGLPGAALGLRAEDVTIAEALKPLGYATGQFGKNHLGDRNEFLPTVHGFDEFFGNLYHLNAEEEPENPDYPKDPPAIAPVLGSLGFPQDRSDDLAGWPDHPLNEIAAELTLGYRLDQVTGKPLPEQSFKGEFLNFTL
jgi:arylsulfatase A-like enzyme